jgi:hypothetical protein
LKIGSISVILLYYIPEMVWFRLYISGPSVSCGPVGLESAALGYPHFIVFIDRFNEWLGTGATLLFQQSSKSKGSPVFKNKPQGSRLKGRPETDGGIMYTQIIIHAKLRIGKR